MTSERLEFIKNLVTDTRHKRIIDELLTEIERLQTHMEPICGICFTQSWQPCPPNTPDCIPYTGGWMVCGYCRLVAKVEELTEEIETLGG